LITIIVAIYCIKQLLLTIPRLRSGLLLLQVI